MVRRPRRLGGNHREAIGGLFSLFYCGMPHSGHTLHLEHRQSDSGRRCRKRRGPPQETAAAPSSSAGASNYGGPYDGKGKSKGKGKGRGTSEHDQIEFIREFEFIRDVLRKGKGKGTSEHDQIEFIRYALDSLPTALILDVLKGSAVALVRKRKGISKGVNMILDEIERRIDRALDDGEDDWCSEPHCTACVMMAQCKGKGQEVEGQGKGKDEEVEGKGKP